MCSSRCALWSCMGLTICTWMIHKDPFFVEGNRLWHIRRCWVWLVYVICQSTSFVIVGLYSSYIEWLVREEASLIVGITTTKWHHYGVDWLLWCVGLVGDEDCGHTTPWKDSRCLILASSCCRCVSRMTILDPVIGVKCWVYTWKQCLATTES